MIDESDLDAVVGGRLHALAQTSELNVIINMGGRYVQGQAKAERAHRHVQFRALLALRTRFVAQQAIDTFLTVSLLPAPDGGTTDVRLPGHGLHAQVLGRKPDDVGSLNVLERTRTIARNRGKLRLDIIIDEHEDRLSYYRDSHASRSR